MAISHLNDTKTYLTRNEDPLNNIFNIVNETLNELYINKHICKELYKLSVPNINCNLGKFRIMPKLHKKKFGIIGQ